MIPHAGEMLPWMRTAALIHQLSQDHNIPYAAAAKRVNVQHADNAHLTVPALTAMAAGGFMPRWETRLSVWKEKPVHTSRTDNHRKPVP